MNLLNLYFLNSWLPTIISDADIPVATAIRLTALFQVGGIGGALVLGAMLDRYFSFWILAGCYLWAAVCVFFIGAAGASTLLLGLTIASAGLGIIGGQNACHALTAAFYPTAIRSTGVGWALGIGRIGSIVGPVLGGLLLARGTPIGRVFWAAAIPALIATTAAAGIALIGRVEIPSEDRHLQSRVSQEFLRPLHRQRRGRQGNRQAHGERHGRVRSRSSLPHPRRVRRRAAGHHARPAADRGARRTGGVSSHRTRGQRRPGGAGGEASRSIHRVCRVAAAQQRRRVARRDDARDRPARRQGRDDLHERRGHAARRAAVPAALRRGRAARRADLAASGARRVDAGLRHRRRAPRSRSGGRSAGRTKPARRWRAWCSPASSIGIRT